MTTTIEQIKDALKAHIAEAEAATPGPWEVGYGNDTGPDDDCFWEWGEAGPARLDNSNSENDATFIAHARTMSPAACKCLLLAIEHLEGIHESTPLGEYAAWDALESIRQEWHNLTQKQ